MARRRNDPNSIIKILKSENPGNSDTRLRAGYSALLKLEGKTYQTFRDIVGTKPRQPNRDNRAFSPADTIRHALENGYVELVSPGENARGINPTSYSKVVSAFEVFDREFRQTRKWADWTNNKAHLHAIKFEENIYPVKKIVSLASGTPVGKFGGGWGSPTQAANSCIQELGFQIVPLRRRNPNWSRDELIITLDFYLKHRDQIPDQSSEEITRLSGLLNRLGSQLHDVLSDNFRNANGVHMKLMNFLGLDPNNSAQGLKHASKSDREIWSELGSAPEKCDQLSRAIIAAIDELEVQAENKTELDDADFDAEEGRVVTRVHVRRERNRKIVEQKKKSIMRQQGFLKCEACGFRFDTTYGDRGSTFIECHHTKPVHEMRAGEKTKQSDLVLLCSNCHRMVHTKRPWLTLNEVRKLPGVKALRSHFDSA